MTTTRGATNGNVRGNNTTRRQRRSWLLTTYRANVDALVCRGMDGTALAVATADPSVHGTWERPNWEALATGWFVEIAARCYRCGDLQVEGVVTVDCIVPRITGGQYGTPAKDRREKRTNVRPACGGCNSETGGALASKPKKGK